LIVADAGREEEIITRLARVGYDYTIGYLQGGIQAWEDGGKETDEIKSITADELASIIEKNKEVDVLDVRKPGEFESGHIVNAISAPLDFLNDSMRKIDKNKTSYVYCASGYRSMIFTSILRARGYGNLVDTKGGFQAIKNIGTVNITDEVCPTALS
jgi:rhodanese-related sulfurtransferase